MKHKLFYFGTDLRSAGHYFWELDEKGFISHSLYFPADNGKTHLNINNWAFNPEQLTDKKKVLTKGEIEYFRIPYKDTDFVVVHIEGSCADTRPGTKSVFWVEGKITEVKLGDLKEIILSNPTAKAIIDKMPFEVKWFKA